MRRLMVAFVLLALSLGPVGTLAAEEESPAGTFGPEQLEELSAMVERANTLWGQGDYEAARGLEEQVVEARTRLLGPEHPSTLTSMDNLALTLESLGDLSDARDLQEQVLEAFTRTLGPEHPDTLTAKNNLAMTLAALDEARPEPTN